MAKPVMTTRLFLVALEHNEAEKKRQAFGFLASPVANESSTASQDTTGINAQYVQDLWGQVAVRRDSAMNCSPGVGVLRAQWGSRVPRNRCLPALVTHLGSVMKEVLAEKFLQHF